MKNNFLSAISGHGYFLAVSAILLVFLILVGVYLPKGGEPADWGGDVFQYIMHAQAILDGRAYGDIPYIFNPGRPWIGPQVYPPGLPIFLIIPILIHGPESDLLGMYQILLMAGTIIFTILVSRQYLPGYWSLVPGGFLAIHPFVVQTPEGLLSDPLFAFLVMAGLYFGNSGFLKEKPNFVLNSVILGALILAAFSTRTIGIVWFPIIVVFAVLQRHRINYKTVVLTLVISATAYILMTLMIGDPLHDYVNNGSTLAKNKHAADLSWHFRVLYNRIWLRLQELPVAISSAWILWDSTPPFTVLSGVCLFSIVTGFLASNFKEIHLSDIFFVGYIGLLIVSPFYINTRIFFPMVPLVYIYLTYGIYFLSSSDRRWFAHRSFRQISNVQRGLRCTLAAPVLAMIVLSHFIPGNERIEYSPRDEYATEMVKFIDNNIPRDAILVSSRPRTMYRLTGLVGSAPPWPLTERGTIDWMKRISARYLLLIIEDFPEPPKTLRLLHAAGYLKLFVLPEVQAP